METEKPLTAKSQLCLTFFINFNGHNVADNKNISINSTTTIIRKRAHPVKNIFEKERYFLVSGNSAANQPIFLEVDTLTSQILLIFSLFVDNVEMINP